MNYRQWKMEWNKMISENSACENNDQQCNFLFSLLSKGKAHPCFRRSPLSFERRQSDTSGTAPWQNPQRWWGHFNLWSPSMWGAGLLTLCMHTTLQWTHVLLDLIWTYLLCPWRSGAQQASRYAVTMAPWRLPEFTGGKNSSSSLLFWEVVQCWSNVWNPWAMCALN